MVRKSQINLLSQLRVVAAAVSAKYLLTGLSLLAFWFWSFLLRLIPLTPLFPFRPSPTSVFTSLYSVISWNPCQGEIFWVPISLFRDLSLFQPSLFPNCLSTPGFSAVSSVKSPPLKCSHFLRW